MFHNVHSTASLVQSGMFMFDVQLVKHVRGRAAHNSFVTGLVFAPSMLAAERNEDALVLSQSSDLRLLAHSLKRRRTSLLVPVLYVCTSIQFFYSSMHTVRLFEQNYLLYTIFSFR